MSNVWPLLRIENGTPTKYSYASLYRDYPELPKRPTAAQLEAVGVFEVTQAPRSKFATDEILDPVRVGNRWIQRRVMKTNQDLIAEHVAAIKEEAGKIILSRYPFSKQINMSTHGSQLENKELAGTITEEEAVILAQYRQIWAWVVAIRSSSNQQEATVATMTRPQLETWTVETWKRQLAQENLL